MNTKQSGGKYLEKLPPTHQELVDQQRPRIGRTMAALLFDEELSDDDLGVIVVADLAGQVGKVIAWAYWDAGDMVDEIRNAAVEHRRPCVTHGTTGQAAIETLNALVEDGVAYAEQRRRGGLILIVVDDRDRTAVTVLLPVIQQIGPGPN